MSWFKRSPRRNEPQKIHVYHPPHPTAAAKRTLEESKEIEPVKKKKKVKPL
jgi:hypothetical protein